MHKQNIIKEKKERLVILNDSLILPTGGHTGNNRMVNNIARRYTWPSLYSDVRNFVDRCVACKKCKIQRHVRAPLEITSTATKAFQKIYLDIVGPLPVDEFENKYILTAQCELTKFVEAYPLKTKESDGVAEKLVNEFILRFGVPKIFATYLGTEFTSNTITSMCKLLKIEKLNSTAYHHESIGAIENSHKQLGGYLKIWSCENNSNWIQWVPFWTFSHNNTVHSATGYAPAELVFGKMTLLPSNLIDVIDPIYNFDSYVNELKYRLQIAWRDAREKLGNSKINYKKYHDRKPYLREIKVGDKVLVFNHARKTKLEPYYKGPYVVRKLELPNIIIDIVARIR